MALPALREPAPALLPGSPRPGTLGWAVPLALAAAVVAGMLLRHGPGISSDETAYLGLAHQLAAGRGFTEPFGDPGARLERYGPGLPLVLAAADRAGVDPVVAGTVLAGVALAASVLLAAGLALRLGRGDRIAALAAGTLLLTSQGMLLWHGRILSEPLYVACLLLFLHALLGLLRGGARGLAVAAGALAAAGVALRYVGVALAAGGAAAVLAVGRGSRRRRAVDAGILAGIALLPVGLWAVATVAAGGTLADRSLTVAGLPLERLRGMLGAVTGWALTFRVPGPVRLAACVVGTAVVVALVRRRPGPLRGRVDGRGVAAVLLVVAAHVAAVAGAMAFLDPNLRFDSRMLLPAEAASAALLGLLAARLLAGATTGRGRALVGAALVALALLHAGAAAPRIARGARGGFRSPAWASSETVAALRRLPGSVVVYASAPDAVWFLTGRPARWLPEERDQYRGTPNPAFARQVAALGADVRAGRAVAVYLDRKTYWHLPTVDELRALLGPVPATRYADGLVLGDVR
jgi:hypothetical protein